MKKNCEVCGKEFITYPSKILLGKGKYCSKSCCFSVTNKILVKNGVKTRIKPGQMPKQFKGFYFRRAKPGGKYYKHIYCPDHPFSGKRKTVREHRLVMEEKIGRYLEPHEIVHHIDGDTLNNHPDNLELMTKTEHDRIHRKQLILSRNK